VSFDANAFHARYRMLKELPESLYEDVLSHATGNLAARVEGVLSLRSALLEGKLPAPATLPWPEASARQSLLRALERLDLEQVRLSPAISPK